MNSRLQSALDELALLLDVADPAPSVERVGMVENGSLSLTLAGARGTRWFLFDDRGLVEQLPRRDPLLPMARTLGKDDRILTYRPRRRLVVERNVQGRPLVLKGFRRRKSNNAARLHQVAEESSGTRSFRVPHLLEHDPRNELLTFAKLEGSPFSVSARSQGSVLDIGRSLAAFQVCANAAVVPLFTHDDELAVLDRWERIVTRIQGRLPERWSACRDEIAIAVEHLTKPRWGLCHRDLHDGQFLETGDGIALLDFDLLCRADQALDPGNLIAHFTLRSLQNPEITEGDVHELSDALVTGLGREADRQFWTGVRFYEATTCLRLALVYVLRPRWAHVVQPLIEVASHRMREIGVLL